MELVKYMSVTTVLFIIDSENWTSNGESLDQISPMSSITHAKVQLYIFSVWYYIV